MAFVYFHNPYTGHGGLRDEWRNLVGRPEALPLLSRLLFERFHPGAIVQPVSSYSNLWYVLIGLGVIAVAKLPISRDESLINLITRNPSYSYTFGIVTIVVGLTSFFYHVSLTLFGRWADYLGMYMVASFIVIYDLTRLRVSNLNIQFIPVY